MDKLVLFDIDKTLIKTTKAHGAVFSETFNKVYGIDTNIDIIEHHGMTDLQIVFEVLKKNGLDEATIKSKLEEYIKVVLSSFRERINKEEIILLDGVRELLDELNKKDVLMGLVTGNLEPVAEIKLKMVGLNDYFKVGGFGSDDVNRTNLVKIAIKKAEDNFNFKFNNNVFLIGDTPRDMKAGKEAGVKTIGVMTGIYLEGQLKEGGADFVLPDLKNKEEILKIIL